jgi:DNA polymerase sigma
MMSRSSAGRVARSSGVVVVGAGDPAGRVPEPRRGVSSHSPQRSNLAESQRLGERSTPTSPLPILEDVPTVGGLDIFSKFSARRHELSDMILAPPPAADAEATVISSDVLEKLRRRQQSMAMGTVGDRSSSSNNNNINNNNSGGVRQGLQRPVSSSSSSSASDDSLDNNQRSSRLRIEDATKVQPKSSLGFEAGESFFSFAPREVQPHMKLTSDSLQATVVLPSSTLTPVTTTTTARGRNKGASSNSPNEASDLAAVRRVVPLWSVERMNLLGGYCSTNARIALHQEIMDLVEYLKPSQAEVSMRRYIELQVAGLARKLFPGCEPVVYGSMTTHLVLPLSDLDMSILNVNVPVDEALTRLAREIGNAGLCVNASPQVILKTKVPLLKFTHKGSLLDVDVSINAGDGRNNSEIMRTLLQRFPEARHLTIVIKYFLQQRDMHEPYKGGLGSYATVILVISFLQHHPVFTTHPHDRKRFGLGGLLVDFFRYYGQCFNYNRCGVSVANDGFYFRRKTQPNEMTGRGPMGPPQVVVEDPGNPENNATSSLRIFPSVASTFDHAYMALTAEFELAGNLEQMRPDSPLVSMRPTLLSRILHVDAISVSRRQAIVDCYHQLLAEHTDHFHQVVHQHMAEEDRQMIRWNSSLMTLREKREEHHHHHHHHHHHRSRRTDEDRSSPEIDGASSAKRRRREGR